jgi:septal ring factor EnvC (AmiA/AmiB activator)
VDKKKEVEVLHQEVDRLERAAQKRIVALYKSRQAGYPSMILVSRSPQDAFRRYRYLLTVVEQDVSLLHDLNDRIQAREKARTRLKQRGAELIRLREAKDTQRSRIQAQDHEKRRLLARIKNKKELQEKALSKFESNATELQKLITSLEEKVRESRKRKLAKRTSFAKQKGRLSYPVAGTVRTAFGRQTHPVLKTFTMNNGIEIQAPAGEEIRAVHPGVVAYSAWVRGYGNVIIIDHGDGYYTLYGHASRLVQSVGGQVSRGEVVAFVGDTGSLSGPSCYFEIRKNGKPLDPQKWIRPPRPVAKNR